MQYAAHIAHYHHEKWNGMGYPERLAGDRIPREARLIALAEFILSSPSSQLEYALSKESDTSFDPEMVTTILLHKEEVLGYIEKHQN
jgi:putative two-component system response regulator